MTATNRSTQTLVLALLLALVSTFAQAQGVDRLKKHVQYLSSSKLEGRMTGSPGEELAADYIIKELQAFRAQPLPGADGYKLPFEFTASVRDSNSWLEATVAGETSKHRTGVEFRALSFSSTDEVEGEVVFAGYGITTPDSKDFSYDSYFGLDVAGKVVIVFRYHPEDADRETRNQLARYSMLRYKAMRARELGAKALLVVTGPRSPNAGELVPLTFDTALSGSGIVAGTINARLAEKLLASAGKGTLEEIQKSYDDGNPHAAGFAVPGVTVKMEVELIREKDTGYNVAAFIPGSGPNADEVVVLGAHYDHLGYGRGGNSLGRGDEIGKIHHGADDNSSGVAIILETARLLATEKSMRNRSLAIAFWSGEELGLLGSADFLDKGHLPVGSIAAYVNFDMVGRAEGNRMTVQAVGSSKAWPALLEETNVPIGFDLTLSEDPWVPSDSTSFNERDIPTLMFFTGSHEDYHRPSDTAEKINYASMDRLVKFSRVLTAKLLNAPERPAFAKVERKAVEGGGRDGVRAYTGTIPDYTQEVEGLKLSGVADGGPASKAGLQGGDVIVEFGGLTISNIYDYTYALDAVKIGEDVKVVYLRGEERRETVLVPEARK